MDFGGKVALVTGSSRNLGAAIALALGERGARVAVQYHRNVERAEAVARQIREQGGVAETFQADAAQARDLRGLAAEVRAQFGQLDILVNNVGLYSDVPFLKLPEALWDAVMNTNVKAAYLLAQEFGPEMKARGWGRVVNIAGASAYLRSQSIYGLAKASLLHLTESLALELAPEVLVNAVAPAQIQESEQIDSDYKARRAAATPLRRLVTTAEVVEAVCLLCSDQFPSMTGRTLVLDGGYTLAPGSGRHNLGTLT